MGGSFYPITAPWLERAARRLAALGLRRMALPPAASVAARLRANASLIAVLPDTQVYARRYPGVFDAQTRWIAARAAALDIRCVVHVGDLVDRNAPREWRRARAAMSRLDGVVPYAVVPGNHDYGPGGDASTRETALNAVFPVQQLASAPTFGGWFEPGKLDNTYHLFSVGSLDLILLCLEWAPRDPVVAWANGVMAAHGDRLGVLATHAYLYEDGLRYDGGDPSRVQRHHPGGYGTPGGVNDAEQLWRKLVSGHRFVLVLSGHVLGRGVARLTSETTRGTHCHQLLANFQMRPLGGEGYLRLLELVDGDATMRVFTYSPFLDRFLTSDEHEFSLALVK